MFNVRNTGQFGMKKSQKIKKLGRKSRLLVAKAYSAQRQKLALKAMGFPSKAQGAHVYTLSLVKQAREQIRTDNAPKKVKKS